VLAPFPQHIPDSGCCGVEVKPAAGAAPEELAQVITGPQGNRPLGLVQQRGRRTIVGFWPVADRAAGKTSTTSGVRRGPPSLKRLAPGAMVCPPWVVGTAHVAVSRIVTLPASAVSCGQSAILSLMSVRAYDPAGRHVQGGILVPGRFGELVEAAAS
jgi:hypothetical protein